MGRGGQARGEGSPVNVLAHRHVVRAAQLLAGTLLAWAALAKLGDIPALARDVHNFRLVPVAAEHLLAIVLPWIELVAALSLVLGIRARAGAVVATGLMVVFTGAVVLAMMRGLNIECGCFGSSGAWRVGPAKLVENMALLGCAGLAALPPRADSGGAPPAPGAHDA